MVDPTEALRAVVRGRDEFRRRASRHAELDSFFTDLRVNRQVRATVERVEAARVAVRLVLLTIADRQTHAEREKRAADQRREELLLRG